MKLNVAAALLQSKRRVRIRLIVSLVLASLLFLCSGVVIAADDAEGGDSQSVESEDPAPEAQADDSETQPSFENATWENSRQIPLESRWTEGDGYWGPSLNQD
jgi:hypothetical protein